MNKEQILLFGASEHARCTIDIIEQVNTYQIIGVIDLLKPKGTECQGYKVLGAIDELRNRVRIACLEEC